MKMFHEFEVLPKAYPAKIMELVQAIMLDNISLL